MKEHFKSIIQELDTVLEGVTDHQTEALAKNLHHARRIFIAGNGRSGLAGKMFAMRLMHIGYEAYVVGETITPSITEDDTLLIISGSGNTKTLVHYATKAKEVSATIALLTTNGESSIAELSDTVVEIPAVTKATMGERTTIQPLGSQFDQSAHLLLDGLIVYFMEHYVDQNHEDLSKKHANLE
ncbi:6-phospho-3-hexuloisomerase [Alkalibacillus salilacus]|uniref:6-phospho-3-hexuloisomerase n=1 Tax=Alkalibacillus salilacus TaxID=284582 RepID=A0ABT9VHX9_9BACI|nr:6-phospho-3-hexuloisomerase [Alkalibacillus salilacus]MDQ0160460.1 6-phospho-3-hexuloisomerase [Alkalibacillus salilacus]